MEKKKAKEVIEQACALLEKGRGPFVAWSGIYNDLDHYYVKADVLFLNIVHTVKGVPRIDRVRPHVMFDPKLGGICLVYRNHNMVKINDGNRKGRVVPIETLNEWETYNYAGVSKLLKFQIASNALYVKKQGDLSLLDLLSTLTGETPGKANIEDTQPPLFTVCKPGKEELSPRTFASVLKELNINLTGTEPIGEKLGAILPTIAKDAGRGMVAYPFDLVYGKGVICASPTHKNKSLGTWYEVPSLKGKNKTTKFECE